MIEGRDFVRLRQALIDISEGRSVKNPSWDPDLDLAIQNLSAIAALGSGERLRSIQNRKSQSELALMRDLRAGLADNQFSVAYQPKLNLRTGGIDSVEVLSRWTHPVRGSVSPVQFIEPAEGSGDIRRLTEQVLTSVLRDQKSLALQGHRVGVHVNLSGRLVTEEGFCRWIVDVCRDAVGPIGMEITETAVIADPDLALSNLHILVEAGIGIAIDDYGSGLSSLAYLKALPASELKIDRAFIAGLSTTNRDPLLVRSTIDLAHALQMEVTAEGVEDPVALALLGAMGCDRAQGYLISRPLDLKSLQVFLTQHSSEYIINTIRRLPLGSPGAK